MTPTSLWESPSEHHLALRLSSRVPLELGSDFGYTLSPRPSQVSKLDWEKDIVNFWDFPLPTAPNE